MARKKRIPTNAECVPFFDEPALPMTREEMDARGWDEIDVLLISGDAHVDHPSFGVPLLGRWLVQHGFRVGIVAQPKWNDTTDFTVMGAPRLFVGVTAGTIDSMLAHHTTFKKKRSDDQYTPGGRAGARPNRASIVYTNLIRQAFPGIPVVIGGVEASLRRATHYDYWSDKIRRSILLDSKADLLVYGMGELAILDIARRLDTNPPGPGYTPETLHGIPGTTFALPSLEALKSASYAPKDDDDLVVLPSYDDIMADEKALMKATLSLERQAFQGVRWAAEKCGNRLIAIAPPARLLTTEEMDLLYSLPYTRIPHPVYTEDIPAAKMIQFSVTSHRGCAGSCSFCSITMHQGRTITSRSADSIKKEVKTITEHPQWRGSITDVGGPTANMWGSYCADDPSTCKRADCLTPNPCKHFKTNEGEQVELLNSLRDMDGVKHLRISSGIRYDMAEDGGEYIKSLVNDYVGGQLKIAPEHMSDKVLKLMRKPKFEKFEKFLSLFQQQSCDAGKEQYVIPYLISGFPGCTDEDMQELSAWLKERNWKPQQVQCFIPTPGIVATAMFYASIDQYGRDIYVARDQTARLRQHRILMPSHGKPVKRPKAREFGKGRKKSYAGQR